MDNTGGTALDAIERDLDVYAQSLGYLSARHMTEMLESGSAKMSKDQRTQALKDLEPMADEAALAAAKAEVDVTGLPMIDDQIRNFVRLIRVLILGYTAEEREFVESRFVGLLMLARIHENTITARERFMAQLAQHEQADYVATSGRSLRP